MHRNHISKTILTILCAAPLTLVSQDFPRARFHHSMTVCDSLIYMFGGFVATEGIPAIQGIAGDYDIDNDLWSFNPSDNRWTQIIPGDLPDKRAGHSMFTINGIIYVFGGVSSDSHNNHSDVWMYDVKQKQFEIANVGGNPDPNAYYTGFTMLESTYVGGGYIASNQSGQQQMELTNHLKELNTHSLWWDNHPTQGGPPPLQKAEGVTFNGKLYQFGGQLEGGGYVQKLFSYDPMNLIWADLTPAVPTTGWPASRSQHQVQVVNDKMILTGGKNSSGPLTDHWEYNFSTNTWNNLGTVPEDVELNGAKSALGPDEVIYYFGGVKSNVPLDNFYKLDGLKWSKYDQDAKRWRRTPQSGYNLNIIIQPKSASENNCYTEPAPGDHEYDEGSVAELSARDNPDFGWYFVEWTGVPGGSAKQIEVLMTEDKNAVAHFKEVKLEVVGLLSNTFCFCEIQDSNQLMVEGTLTAYGDDWSLSGFTLNESYVSDFTSSNMIDSAELRLNDRVMWSGNAGLSASIAMNLFEEVIIPEGQSIQVELRYYFDDFDLIWREDSLLSEHLTPIAKPVHYLKGNINGVLSGYHYLGNYFLEKTVIEKGYININGAIRDANFLDAILICEGTHELAVSTYKYLRYKPKDISRKPILNPLLFDVPIFDISRGIIEDLILAGNDNGAGIACRDDGYEQPVTLINVEIARFDKGISFAGGTLEMIDSKVHNCHTGLNVFFIPKWVTDDGESAFGSIKLIRSSATDCTQYGVNLSQKVSFAGDFINISDCWRGINAYRITNFDLRNSNIARCLDAGVYLEAVDQVDVSTSIFNNNYHGLNLQYIAGESGGIYFNHFLSNCTGIVGEGTLDPGFRIFSNVVSNSYCESTGISLNNASPSIEFNRIENNAGSAILTSAGSVPAINRNNFSGNVIAVRNKDALVHLTLGENYWGSPAGPSGNDVLGGVNISEWLIEPADLATSFKSDTVFLVPETNDSIPFLVSTLYSESDQVTLSIQDELGWLTGKDRDALSIDKNGTNYWIQIESGNENSLLDKLTVITQSATDPGMVNINHVILMAYQPELTSLVIVPDSLMLLPDDTLALFPLALDQHKRAIAGQWVWTTDHGTIDHNGLLVCDGYEGPIEVTLVDRSSGKSSSAHFYSNSDPENLETIIITPVLDTLTPGMNSPVDVLCLNQLGFPMIADLYWESEGGQIDQAGMFTAGNDLGYATITAKDLTTGVSGSCDIFIVATLSKSEVHQRQSFFIYPNPASDKVTLSFDKPLLGQVDVRIFDLFGKVCFFQTFEDIQETSWSISLGEVSNGLYIIQVQANDAFFVSKLFVK